MAFVTKEKLFSKDFFVTYLWLLGGSIIFAFGNALFAEHYTFAPGGVYGLGIVFSVDGSTGGTDLIALMVNRVIPSLPVSKCLTIIDGMVVLSAGIANGNIETGLYSAIALYIIVKVIDAIISGFDYSKAFMIITEDRDELKEAIVNDIKRGVTILDGKGGYTNNDKSILLVVVNNKKQEVSLKKLIKKVDPSAFIIVSDVHEVLGEGFKSIAA